VTVCVTNEKFVEFTVDVMVVTSEEVSLRRLVSLMIVVCGITDVT
jgi:hypothetical protein